MVSLVAGAPRRRKARPACDHPRPPRADPRSGPGRRRAARRRHAARCRLWRRADRSGQPRARRPARRCDLLRRLGGAPRRLPAPRRRSDRRCASSVRARARRRPVGHFGRLGRRRHHALGADLRRRQASGVRRVRPGTPSGRARVAVRADQPPYVSRTGGPLLRVPGPAVSDLAGRSRRDSPAATSRTGKR